MGESAAVSAASHHGSEPKERARIIFVATKDKELALSLVGVILPFQRRNLFLIDVALGQKMLADEMVQFETVSGGGIGRYRKRFGTLACVILYRLPCKQGG